jgi:hypothetical protein
MASPQSSCCSPPEEMFFRAFGEPASDASELSLSNLALKSAAATNPNLGVPACPLYTYDHLFSGG